MVQHDWSIEEREYLRHEERRGRRHAFESLDPTRTALVVVDLVAFFVDENAYARGVVPNVNELADVLRRAGGTVAWVVSAPWQPSTMKTEPFGPGCQHARLPHGHGRRCQRRPPRPGPQRDALHDLPLLRRRPFDRRPDRAHRLGIGSPPRALSMELAAERRAREATPARTYRCGVATTNPRAHSVVWADDGAGSRAQVASVPARPADRRVDQQTVALP